MRLLVVAVLMASSVPLAAQQRFLALGDSYTIGEGAADSQRWPVQLAVGLRARGIDVTAPQIIARTGWTAEELDSAITRAAPQGPFALVTLLIGVNNQYRGLTEESFRTQFQALLTRAVGFAGGTASRVIVVSIPDWGVTPFNTARDASGVAREIDAHNAIVRAGAEAAGAPFVDITDLTRGDPGAVVADGLHPNGSMYTRWVERILPVAEKALR